MNGCALIPRVSFRIPSHKRPEAVSVTRGRPLSDREPEPIELGGLSRVTEDVRVTALGTCLLLAP